MKKTLSLLILQIIPVMIGVYLGFAINNLGDKRKLQRQLDDYSELLKTEISDNLQSVKRVQPYHVELVERFSSLAESDDLMSSFQNFKFEGFKSGFVSKSAFDTGVQTGIIQAFDLDLIQSINRLYTLQNRYSRFNENMIDSFLAQGFPQTEIEIKSLLTSSSMSMGDIVIFERELTSFYKYLLESLENQ